MDIWVYEQFVCDDNSTYIELYESKADAAKQAATDAKERMSEMNCDDPDASCEAWHDAYVDVCKFIQTCQYEEARKAYSDWNDNLDDYTDQVNFFVYEKAVHPIQRKPTAAIADKPAAIAIPQNEVPCKCCKTNLYEGESPCWKCGADNPTG